MVPRTGGWYGGAEPAGGGLVAAAMGAPLGPEGALVFPLPLPDGALAAGLDLGHCRGYVPAGESHTFWMEFPVEGHA